MKNTLIVVMFLFSTPTLACSPAPSCWFKYGPEYMRSVCLSTLRNFRSSAQIIESLDEPRKFPELVSACRKLNVNLVCSGCVMEDK